VRLLQQTGIGRQREFMKELGFTEQVKLDFPETAKPQYPHEWKDIQAMTVSYGHGISVTPLHLVRAISGMVNGGVLPEMTLLKSDATAKGERVIKKETSAQIRELMRQVVEYGTARKAQVAGYRVGGKTGTADKIINGRYAKDKRIASFVSAFPIRDPKYVLFVMVDEPKGRKETAGYATGGWVAAPVAAEVISRIGPMLGIAPDHSSPDLKEIEFWERSNKRNYEARQAYYNRGRTPGIHAASY
jgi:cell division protein FtsI (penicillin-binding protein 3)